MEIQRSINESGILSETGEEDYVSPHLPQIDNSVCMWSTQQLLLSGFVTGESDVELRLPSSSAAHFLRLGI